MTLNIQIISLSFSLIFGFLFSLFVNINHRIIYNSHKFVKILGTILIVFLSVLIYFIILEKINNATFHPYEIFMIILGYYLESLIHYKKKITI